MKIKENLRTISETSLTVSLSMILGSMVLFRMPFGGHISMGGCVPIVFFSFKRGAYKGISAAVIYAFIHAIFSFTVPPAKNLFSIIWIIILDYIIFYVVIALAPVCAVKLKTLKHKVYFGTACVFFLRIITGTFSGVVFWSEYMPGVEYLWMYSLIYNCLYTVPECIITLLICKNLICFL